IRRKNFVEIHGRLHQAWDDYEEEKLSTTDLLRTISHINALGPSTARHHMYPFIHLGGEEQMWDKFPAQGNYSGQGGIRTWDLSIPTPASYH
ncbi:hypothetical protein DPMN_185332, partial [Dreissena polymorpha]